MSARCGWRRWLLPGCCLNRPLPQPSWGRAKLSNLIKRSPPLTSPSMSNCSPPAMISGISSPVSATKISHSASSVRRSRLLPELTESRKQEEEKNMRATVYHGPGDMRIDQVPDPSIQAPTDVVARITHAGICGSVLWSYRGIDQREPGDRMGHEWMGMVEEVGAEVRTLKKGDRVISPFLISDGTCEFCRAGLPSSCVHGERWGGPNDGGQGEAIRVPYADGTLVVLPPSVEGDEHLRKRHPSPHRCHGDRPSCCHHRKGQGRQHGSSDWRWSSRTLWSPGRQTSGGRTHLAHRTSGTEAETGASIWGHRCHHDER